MTKGLEKEADFDTAIQKIAKAIRDNRDVRKLNQIQQEFNRLYKEQYGIVDAEVVSALALSDEQLKKIKKTIAEKYNTKEPQVNIQNAVDMSIKGGVIIKIGNEIWDGSVKSKLEKLKAAIQ